MNRIPTFLCNYTPSLLKDFSFGCLGRRRGKRKPDEEADVDNGVASPCEKNGVPFLYDPAIEKPVVGDDQEDVVEISLVSEGEDEAKETASMAPVSRAQPTKARSKSPVVEEPLQKPARAKLLDLLIQFPLPPSAKDDETATQDTFSTASKSPRRQRKTAKKQHGVKKSSVDIVDPQAAPASTPLSPVSTRRSSLVWFADKSTCGDDLSTDSNNGRVQCSGTEEHSPEWISEWRDDMATVLKQLQEIKKQEEDEDFRDLLANASVSSHGSSALSRSSASLSGQAVRWSGKWAVQSCDL